MNLGFSSIFAIAWIDTRRLGDGARFSLGEKAGMRGDVTLFRSWGNDCPHLGFLHEPELGVPALACPSNNPLHSPDRLKPEL